MTNLKEIEFENSTNYNMWDSIYEAELNGCTAQLGLDENAFDIYWRTDDAPGHLVIWHNKFEHLADDKPGHDWQNTREYNECGGGENYEWMDYEVAIQQLREDWGCLVLPVYISDFGSNGLRISEAFRDKPHGVLYMSEKEIAKDYDDNHLLARQALKSEVKQLDTVLEGDIWIASIYDHNGILAEICSGIFGLEEAEREAAGFLLQQAKTCQRCDGSGNALGVPCQECLGSGDTDRAEALLV